MSLVAGPMFKMTRKTRLFLALHKIVMKLDFFYRIDQWLLRNCDFEEGSEDPEWRRMYWKARDAAAGGGRGRKG